MNARWITRTLAVAAMGALALMLVPAAAEAQTTANLNVSALVARNCRISATPLAFGNYDPITANATVPLDGTATISVACNRGSVGVWVGLNLGQNAAGAVRRMISGADVMTYELYSDTPGGTVWGNAVGSGLTWPLFANHSPVDRTVHGRVPAGQDVVVGAYSDTVVATVNF